MLQVRSFISGDWFDVLDISEDFVTYQYNNGVGKINLPNAQLRFRNKNGSCYIMESEHNVKE